MKLRPLAAAVLAVCIGISSSAFAQRDGDHERGDEHGKPLPMQHGKAPMRHDMHEGERGAGPDHNFYRGGRLPSQYNHYHYVVEDWRGHHLTAPPAGYHWVQTGADYVLVAVATGIIAQVLLGN